MEISNSNSPTQNPTRNSKIAAWAVTVGLLLTGIGGGFAPWIYRESVALQLTAPGLAEFVSMFVDLGAADGALSKIGLIALPEAERMVQAEGAKSMKPLAAGDLK